MSEHFDVIVVGAGASGVPLAARLSEDPARSVLLLEAGPWFRGIEGLPPELRHGGLFGAGAPTHPNNWAFLATLRPGVDQVLPRGRVVGGSTTLNGTLFTRGLPADFDGWAAAGSKEWSYAKVLPFFRRLERDLDIHDEYHGDSGPMPVRRAPESEWTSVTSAFVDASRGLGYPLDPDVNGPDSIGVGPLAVNNIDGVRYNTGLAYLEPIADRPNLTVRPDSNVRRVVLSQGRAVGVEVQQGSDVTTVYGGEIVLSAGAIKSPQLLMLSGIGPADELTRLGIPVSVESPHVGRNFTDHCSMHVQVRFGRQRHLLADPTRHAMAQAALHYTSDGNDELSDMMLMQSITPLNAAVLHGVGPAGRLKILVGALGQLSWRQVLEQARSGWLLSMTLIIMRGNSRGEIRLKSANPDDKPALLYHYFEDPADLRRMREAFRVAAAIVRSDAYRALGARWVSPEESILESDKQLDQFMLQHVGTSMHKSSTCRMAPTQDLGVVDETCCVHGAENLRVVDTSIMPTVVRRCPAATAVMLGERAAAFFG